MDSRTRREKALSSAIRIFIVALARWVTTPGWRHAASGANGVPKSEVRSQKGPLPPCAAGEPVWPANTSPASRPEDPCQLAWQVNQFGGLKHEACPPRPPTAASLP